MESLQCLICEGKLLQYAIKLNDYGIQRNSTITLNMRLKGGPTSPNGLVSFKDVVKGGILIPDRQTPNLPTMSPYIVE